MCTYTIQKSPMDDDSLLVPLNQPIKGREGNYTLERLEVARSSKAQQREVGPP